MKGEIREYQETKEKDVEIYWADLTTKREKVQETQVVTRRFLRDNNVKEIISQKEERFSALTTASDTEIGPEFDCPENVLRPTGIRNFSFLQRVCAIFVYTIIHKYGF